MTQPVPDGIFVLLPEFWNDPIKNQYEVYGAVIQRTTDGDLDSKVIRVALSSINQDQQSVVVPSGLVTQDTQHTRPRSKDENLTLQIRTYDESSIPDFIDKIKAITKQERLTEEDLWVTVDTVQSASLALEIQTDIPTYLARRPLVRWSFKKSDPKVSSLGNCIHFSGTTRSLVIDGLSYSISNNLLTQIRNAVLGSLDDIVQTYQSTHERELLLTLNKCNTTRTQETQNFSYHKIPLSSRNYIHRYSSSLENHNCNASLSATIVIVSLVVFILLINNTSSERTIQ